MGEQAVGARKDKAPKPATGEAWGILNPYGDLWTYETFRTPAAAMAHVASFWRGINHDLGAYKAVRVEVRVTVLPEPPSPSSGGKGT